MAYCSLSDLYVAEQESALIQLTDDAGAGTVNTTVLNAAIAEADDIIDATLRGRVDMPSPVPKIISHISVELTISGLFRRRAGSVVPDSMSSRRKEALAMLEKIAEGRIRISDVQSNAKRAASSTVTSKTRIFTDDTLNSYRSVQ